MPGQDIELDLMGQAELQKELDRVMIIETIAWARDQRIGLNRADCVVSDLERLEVVFQ